MVQAGGRVSLPRYLLPIRASLSWELSRDPAPQTLRYSPTNYSKTQLLIAAHLLEAACTGSHYLKGTTIDADAEPIRITCSIAHGLLPKIIAHLQ